MTSKLSAIFSKTAWGPQEFMRVHEAWLRTINTFRKIPSKNVFTWRFSYDERAGDSKNTSSGPTVTRCNSIF